MSSSEHQIKLGSVNTNGMGESSRRFEDGTSQLSGVLAEHITQSDPPHAFVFFESNPDEAFLIEDDELEPIKKRVETDELAEEMVVTAIKRYTSPEN